ncbi:MAG: flavin reductase family protein [Christensenellales bacterium]
MKVSLGPGTLLSPTPVVMVSCAREGLQPNIITLAWVGTICSDPPMLSISVRPERYSHDIIRDTGEFVVNLVGRDLLQACDFCGVKSGRSQDKFAACGLHTLPVPELRSAPAILESPLHLACRVRQQLALGSHTLFLADIVAVAADEGLMAPGGKLDLARADLVAYSHGDYHPLSPAVGFFGCSVAKPEVLARRLKAHK